LIVFPPGFFRNCAVELTPLVLNIFNQSLSTGDVPSPWLTAIVTPVPKIDTPKLIADYRPISVTSTLSRLLERHIAKTYLLSSLNPLSIADQYAFKLTGSTTCALIDVLHFVTKCLESCNYVRCLMVDFSKAFDTVDREILLRKLAAVHLPSSILKWISNYLSNRFQLTTCNESFSDMLPINQGVVQGSAIGPTLFTLMISDLAPLSPCNKFVKFADDLSLLVPSSSDCDIVQEYSAIQKWASTNKMIINPEKTKEIVFHRPRPLGFIAPPPLDGIQRVFIAKLLGVTLTDSLSFSEHVAFIITQCNQRSYLLRTLKRCGMCPAALEVVLVLL